MPKGRKPLNIPKERLAQAIADAEKDGPLPSLGVLWQVVGRAVGAGASTASTYAGRYGLTYITQGIKAKGTHLGRSSKVKMDSAEAQDHMAALKRSYDRQYHQTINKIKGGSLLAAIKLKCLDCCCFDKEEIRHCPAVDCALWLRRPYKPNTGDSNAVTRISPQAEQIRSGLRELP